MNKQVEQIKTEIERCERICDDFISTHTNVIDVGISKAKKNICKHLKAFIDSMQEEPVSDDLQKFAEEWDESLYRSDAVIAGAKWKERQMMKDAIDGEIFDIFYPNGDRLEIYAKIPEDKFAGGDKVKLLIIKEK